MVRTHHWWQEYTSAGYVELIQTHQNHILLPEAERGELLTAVGGAIDRAGGVIRLPFGTRICLARRC